MLKSFFYSFIITFGFIITAYNINEAKNSLDRCESLIQEIKKQGEYLEIIKSKYNF